MNYTNLIYLVMWVLIYYAVLIFVPYGTDFLQNDFLGSYWDTIPSETHFLIQILLYIVVPLVGIAFTISSSRPEQQTVVVRR